MEESTVRVEQEESTLPEPMSAPDHHPEVVREAAGELVLPNQATDEARGTAIAMLRRVLGKQDAHFGTVAEARQAFALVWNNLESAAGSFAQQRMTALIEMFQANEQATIKAALSKEGLAKGSTDYVRTSELTSLYNAYLLLGTEALESATFNTKGLPHSWEATRKAVGEMAKQGKKIVLQRMAYVEADMKVRAAMKVPGTKELSPEAQAKARQMAEEQLAADERQAELEKAARETPQGIAQTIATSIIRRCKYQDGNVEKIDTGKAADIAGKIESAVHEEIKAIELKAAEAEKKAAETTKH